MRDTAGTLLGSCVLKQAETQDRSRSGQFIKTQNESIEWETGQNAEIGLTNVAQGANTIGKKGDLHVMHP